MIQVDLITGILGSGKTTLIMKYAAYLMEKGCKIGILEYDYGAANVDMMLLNSLRGELCELEMVAAACDEDCLRRRFKTKLISMAMSGYDRVIVEPSGVFDMDMFFDVLREEPLENWYEIGNVITVVNANLSDDLTGEENFFLASQASAAGMVVFSRTQLSTPEKIQKTKEYLSKQATKIRCSHIPETYMEKDWEQLTEEDMEKLFHAGYHVGDYVKVIAGKDLDFSSLCYMERTAGLSETVSAIQEVFRSEEYGNIIRVKGFVPKEDGFIQINGSQYELLTQESVVGQNILIVIGTSLQKEKLDELFGNQS